MKSKETLLSQYEKYYVNRQFDREEVFLALKEKYGIEKVLYPGSYIHITPSFVFKQAVYVDNDKGAKQFFKDMDLVKSIVKSKRKAVEADIQFFGQSYHNALPFEDETFDLLISHYAGIISQPCKRYLKIGGHLLVNNSHADAGVAHLDPDYTLVATINLKRKNLISEDGLADYFKPKKAPYKTKNELIQSQKGIGYTKTADLYVFRRVK